MSFGCMKNMKASLLSESPPMQDSEVSDGGEEEVTTSQSSASMQVFAAVMVFSECSLNNRCHFCRILKIPYQALKLLQICGSTTCLPAVQLLLQMWLGWSMTLLLSACLVLKCKHNSLSKLLSSPRPKGERASRARAVTVSQCPHSEVGQDFLLCRRVTLTETAVTRKRKV